MTKYDVLKMEQTIQNVNRINAHLLLNNIISAQQGTPISKLRK